MNKDIAEVIDATEERFTKIAPAEIRYDSEKGFAIQLMRNNPWLNEVAQANPPSLQQALTNVAAIGLSLNPAKKQAYLITRNIKVANNQYQQRIFLEPSYMGLCDLATQSGMIEWIQAGVVRENDDYANLGPGERPRHIYNAFKDRGQVVGFYCVAKTTKGDYLTTEMEKSKIDDIMERSESIKSARKKNKAPHGPWVTDYEEMAKKTVVRNAFKMWPKSKELQRMGEAVNISNDNLGFEAIETTPEIRQFNVEQKAYYDSLIENNDAINMFVFRSTIDENIFSALYHSFPDGQKGKYQRIVDALIKRGGESYRDYRDNIMEGLVKDDDALVVELVEDCGDSLLEMIKQELTPEQIMQLKEVTGK